MSTICVIDSGSRSGLGDAVTAVETTVGAWRAIDGEIAADLAATTGHAGDLGAFQPARLPEGLEVHIAIEIHRAPKSRLRQSIMLYNACSCYESSTSD